MLSFDTLLVANRGEIACRVMRSAKALGLKTVAVYSEADAQSLHVRDADVAIAIGPAPASQSYLDVARVLDAAAQSGAGAIHPGYGFLSENPEFAEACERAGIAFVGPTPAQIRAFGLKHEARRLAELNGVPMLKGSALLADLTEARAEAARIGYPVMLKSTAGGGGIGMAVCRDETELGARFETVRRLAKGNFSDAGVFLERFVARARHVEVQLFGAGDGRVRVLGVRDCSAQRRNQKVIEETPAPSLTRAQHLLLTESAARLAQAVQYRSAGTVEFVLDADSGEVSFLEVNTRLQVEHCVTEDVYGVDLVAHMLQLAGGDRAMFDAPLPSPRGHSIEVRLYAEDPARSFQPSSGLLTEVSFPSDVRVETWVETGVEMSPHYDPLLAKLITHGDTREAARSAMVRALSRTSIYGVETNRRYALSVLEGAEFVAGTMTTGVLGALAYAPDGVEVLESGTQTTLQDAPGRVGYWDVGVPPSGPMDLRSFRLANVAVGNQPGAPALELTVLGPTLRFHTPAVVALAGAPLSASLDGVPVKAYTPLSIGAGQTLRIATSAGEGARAYLAVRGGFDVPSYLGSAATFTLGRFGGHGGRALVLGDVLRARSDGALIADDPKSIPASLHTPLTHTWELAVMEGPHAAPDFFTREDVEVLFDTEYVVHHNSARTGVRLAGPKPSWARADGGEAGLHPSNIHDNAYAVGAVDFTGDMPIILGPDGPSLGGFVCPATVVSAELWKLGQLRPGDRVRFRPISADDAAALRAADEELLRAAVKGEPHSAPALGRRRAEPVLHRAQGGDVEVAYRQAGDGYLLVEYGAMVLDLGLRFRVHALMERLRALAHPALRELTPGIRTLQIRFDPRALSQSALLDLLTRAEAELGSVADLVVPSRVVHMPLSWDDPQTRLAIEKYMTTVRADAPWTPSNIEFIRRINGLADEAAVRRIVFDASYLVMGLGDVYLGAPVATPLDPRHRLVTTKYNPARTWTPENAVGIGGAYMCIYGMEGPGGYQFVGRTLPVYNRFRVTRDFAAGTPWLLRFFDQVRFHPVDAAELLELRRAFTAGRHALQIEHGEFRYADYRAFLERESADIEAFRVAQRRAFAEERERWRITGQHTFADAVDGVDASQEIPAGSRAVAAHVPGSVFRVLVAEGQRVSRGEPLVVLESMKMEIVVMAPEAGEVTRVLCREGQTAAMGQTLVSIAA
jgi:urea carboxylase